MAAVIRVEILGNASGAQGAAQQAQSSYKKFGDSMEQLAAPAAVGLGAVALFGKGAIDAASTAQQAMGGVNAVFGSSAQAIHDWSKSAASDVGLSGASYETLAAQVGGALTGMGVSQDEAAKGTHDLMLRAADLASVFGGDTQQATEAITSAFRGEYDSLQRLIPSINAAKVEALLAAKGQDKLTGAAAETAKAQAIMSLIMDGSAVAAGNFAKEADTAEGAQQRANAAYQDAMAAIGTALLPMVTDLATAFQGVAKWVGENSTLVLTFAGIIGGLSAAILGTLAVMKAIEIAQAAWTAVQLVGTAVSGGLTTATTALSAAFAFLAANPIILVIAAIVAIIAAIVLLWNKSDAFREAVIGIWTAISDAAVKAWEWIKEIAGKAWDWITEKATAAGDFIAGIWQGIADAASAAWQWVKDLVAGTWSWIVEKANAAGETLRGIWETIKSVGVSCWEAIKSAVDALLTPFRAVRDAVQWLIDKLKMAWDWAGKVISKIPFVGSMLGASGAGTVSATAAAVPLVGARAGGGARSPVNIITVQGALDPVGVARQIEELLRTQGRRTGAIIV